MSSPNYQEYLSKKDEPIYRIRCPVHGFIHFSENEKKIIDHWIFQRLRFIRQLALTEYVYPGATHTRFEHSLGVMEMATRMFDSIISKKHDTLLEEFKEIPELSDEPLAKARTLVRLTALLHDVGHIFFSHASEEVILPEKKHEWLSEYILKQNDLLGGELEKIYGADISGISGLVADIVSKEITTKIPQLTLLSDIISGSMDADRTDYLIRDSLHCGVDYGRFDFRRLIECLELEQTEDGKLKIAIDEGGLQSFEALILARYQINTQVYHHRIRSIYDKLLQNYVSARGSTIPVIDEVDDNKILSLLKLNDTVILSEIFKDAESNESAEVKKWAKYIAERKIFRIILDTGFELDDEQSRKFKSLDKNLRDANSDFEFITITKDIQIHNLWIPDIRSDEGKNLDWMKVVGRTGDKIPVGKKSFILRNIPRQLRYGRIFVNLSKNDSKLTNIIKYIESNW